MSGLITNLPLVIYILFLAGYLINALFVVYHLLKFGLDYKTKLLAFIFSVGLILLIIVNFRLFSKIEWAELIYEYLSFPKII